MARQKIEDKQKAILDAAIAVFSERGFWNTPTSLISKTAGVADGTLFNYFETKDALINEVYLEIKRELAAELFPGLSAYETLQDKMRHIWNHYVDWGVRNPDKFKVLHQISESFELDAEVLSRTTEPFAEIDQMARESIAKGEFRDYPMEYLTAMIDSQAVMTIRFITTSHQTANPQTTADYRKIGFD